VFDTVVDATVVVFANNALAIGDSGVLGRCLTIISEVIHDERRCRYNSKLLGEYIMHVGRQPSDFVHLFFGVLESSRAVLGRNSLCPGDRERAESMKWPSHDRHLLAAAVGGENPCIMVTERRLASLHEPAKREFGVCVKLV
jgi:hypothetical protein